MGELARAEDRHGFASRSRRALRRATAHRFRRIADVAAAAAEAGVSPRRLERRFGVAVGLSPRQFARLRRVRAAIGAIAAGERSVARLARRAELAPSAFLREFRSVAGLAPLALMNDLDQLEHASRTGVSAS